MGDEEVDDDVVVAATISTVELVGANGSSFGKLLILPLSLYCAFAFGYFVCSCWCREIEGKEEKDL